MDLRLLVLRTNDIKKLADFYSLFGLTFVYHKHGSSPYHYSTTIGQMVLEIYPLTKSQKAADKNLRLGFGIDNFEGIIKNLKELQIPFSMEPTQTDFGFMTIISDPDERKIEIYKNNIPETRIMYIESKGEGLVGEAKIANCCTPILNDNENS